MKKLALFLGLTVACGTPQGDEVDMPKMTYEEFKARVYIEPDSGLFIVDGDIPIESEGDLRAYYEEHAQPGRRTQPLIVNRVGSADDRWSDAQKLNISYCVSTTFGSQYSAVAQAMTVAAGAWKAVANIDFVYRADQDGACGASNGNVVFDVRPTSGQSYLARAFFPSFSRANRSVLIDSASFGAIAPYTLAGILRHELGHTLGFRHEHIRPEANPAGTCVSAV